MDLSGADVNCVDASGRTALSHIAAHGSLPMLEALLQHPEVDVNKADNEGNTPLHYAAQAGHVEVLNYLLSRRPDVEVDARNALGFTALMKAALQGRTKCAKLLLFAGASPTLRDSGRGLRAEQWARFCGRYVCAEVIEKFARHRLLERTTAYGRWGSEPELGARLLLGARASAPEPRASPPPSHGHGLKSRLRKAFRTNSSGSSSSPPPAVSRYSLVTQLTTAALCASSPVLPAAPHVPPVVKSLIRPLTVPKVQVTLAGSDNAQEAETEENVMQQQQPPQQQHATQQKPPTAKSAQGTARHKKKK
ncbi:ankyrin repeat domain-containing protein 33B-like isoform X2 [Schistocerca gregaria]|uniref:ankyrin repeat domain-containing protein 33B-like isoform X2 n=1 Tax=Schistocerca gregaria TaxID=7010 RepID=UPI00211DB768|nr:ankyrin repeat domain-containing protein 33B-like isoform X2 [Schistocerca gregaria]